MAPIMLKRTRWTILLSINAAAILIAGIAIASAIWFNGGTEFKVVGERSDIINRTVDEANLLEAMSNSETSPTEVGYIGNNEYISTSSHEFDNTEVGNSELWNESAITIYATPDVDICVSGSLSNLGEMY